MVALNPDNTERTSLNKVIRALLLSISSVARALFHTGQANDYRRTVTPSSYSSSGFLGRKDFLPVEPQSGLSFLFLLGAPRFA
jgi:hypothetical protein